MESQRSNNWIFSVFIIILVAVLAVLLLLTFSNKEGIRIEEEGIRRMKVVAVPCWEDNYAYLLIDEKNGVAGAVDPVEPEKVIAQAEKLKVKIVSVLTTHHHQDHSGGNVNMVKERPGIKVYGGDDRIPALTDKVGDGDQFTIGDLNVKIFFTPCHTKGHVLYYVTSSSNETGVIFTGDTLFIAGCGRFFEGEPKQMNYALNQVIANLPGGTQVYCGHEYTVTNLKFAKTIEPENKDILDKLEWAQKKRANQEFTIPSTIDEELKTNPFMRVTKSSVVKGIKLEEGASEDSVMKALRQAKDSFKG